MDGHQDAGTPVPTPVTWPWESVPALAAAREHYARHDHDAALAVALQLVEGAPDARVGSAALSLAADCCYGLDRYEEALNHGLRAVRGWRALGEMGPESLTRTLLARVLDLVGEPAEALEESLAAVELADLAGDLYARMLALTAVGVVHLTLENFDLAIRYTERAAETARLRRDEIAHATRTDTVACVYVAMAQAARNAGRPDAALRYGQAGAERSQEALDVLRRHGRVWEEAIVVGNLAEGLMLAGRPEDARAVLDSYRSPEGDAASIRAQHLDVRGSICLTMGRHVEAVGLFLSALELSPGANQEMTVALHLSEAYEQLGDPVSALARFKQYHQLFRQVAAETAQRSAKVAEIRLETASAQARVEQLRSLNDDLLERTESLLRQSLEDPLTGLANRRWLDHTLESGPPVTAVALLDVDHFKRINDRWSHSTGDDVLRHLGKLVGRFCSATGAEAARYGGEEFILLFHDRTPLAAAELAEQLREAVALQPWGDVAPGLAVTVSIGVAGRDEGAELADVVALADRRLYQAKDGGRDLVVGPVRSPRTGALGPQGAKIS